MPGQRRTSLSGAWSGAFRYPDDTLPETVFNAQIEESSGAFVGAVQEPNLVTDFAGAVITAEIEGVRSGATVTFTKFYQASAQVEHAIRYEGSVDEGLTRIEGVWIIPGEWSGTFFMTRDDDGAEANAAEAAEVHARRKI